MNYTLIEWFSYSVGIGAVLGLVKINKIDRAYIPFIVLLWVGLLTEFASTLSIRSFGTNAISDNIYSLAEILLVLWFFKRQRLFEKKPSLYGLFFLMFLISWVIINLTGWVVIDTIVFSIRQFSPRYNIAYSFCLVLMSIHFISQLLIKEKNSLKKNPAFLIAIGFITLFTVKIIVEIFWLYGLVENNEFSAQVYSIHTWINLSVNLLFALAVLWIPAKRKYTLL